MPGMFRMIKSPASLRSTFALSSGSGMIRSQIELRTAWYELLNRYSWAICLTLTFDRSNPNGRGPPGAERLDKAFRGLVRFANERLYGRRWMSKCCHKGVTWARATELHTSGAPHFHAVLGAPTRQEELTSLFCKDCEKWWRSRYGTAKIELILHKNASLLYMVKCVGSNLEFEVDLSFNLPIVSL